MDTKYYEALEYIGDILQSEVEPLEYEDSIEYLLPEIVLRVYTELGVLRTEVKKLRGFIDKTTDDKLVPEVEHFFCPKCNYEVRQEYNMCYCDECSNPDSNNCPPLPLFYTQCSSRGITNEE